LKILPHKKKKKLKKDKAYVLLSTGSFNPVHRGHIEMLECAKKEVEKTKVVLGGFLSVSHDSYVFTKDSRYQMSASYRAWLCDQMIAQNSWLATDTWEALDNTYAVNFTDVILRLQWVLNERLNHLNIPIDIVYVYGSDNYSFMDAFIARGYSVCVPRIEEDIAKCERKKEELLKFSIHKPETRLFVSALGYEMSSTKIRNKELSIDNILKSAWEDKKPEKNLTYLIRDDSLPSTAYCKQFIPDYINRIKIFKNDFFEIFNNLFHIAELDAHPIVEKKSIPIINLDTWVEVENSLPLRASRVFKVNDPQIFSKEIYIPKAEHLEAIKNSSFTHYILMDDDIATGFTTSAIKALLHPKICDEVYSLNPYKSYYDVIDIRDFIIGSQYGGLLCRAGGLYFRAPYFYPFVNLFSRAKIPFGKEVEITKKIIELNQLLFQGSPLKIKDTQPEFQNFCIYLGIDLETTIEQLLKKIKP